MRLADVLGIHAGEGRLALLLAAVFAVVEAGLGFGTIASDTLVLSRVGASALPYLFVALGVVALVVITGYGVVATRVRAGALQALLFVGALTVLLVERLALVSGIHALYPVVWLSVYAIAALAATATWALAGSALDARQAKRLFPLLSGSAILGALVGTLGAGPATRLLGAEELLLVTAALLSLGALLAARLATAPAEVPRRVAREPFLRQLGAGFDEVRRSRLMRLVAISYVLLAVLSVSVSVPFYSVAATAFPDEPSLAGFLGLLATATTGVAFVVAVLVANRVYARIGVAGAALVLPLVYAGGFAVWIAAFSLATAAGFRLVQQVVQRGLTNPAFSAIHNVVPAERRAQVMAFNDGVPGQLGTSLAGLLLVASGTLVTRDQLILAGLASAVACSVLLWLVRRRYGEALVTTLRSGLVHELLAEGGRADIALDAQARSVLADGLHDPSPSVRRLSAQILGQGRDAGATPSLLEALVDPEAEVRAAALVALASVAVAPAALGGDVAASTAIAAALADPDPAVRAAAVDATVATRGRHGLPVESLRDPDALPRSRVVVARLRGDPHDAHARAGLEALLTSDAPSERALALASVAELGGVTPPVRLADHLADPSPLVRSAAAIAIGDAADRASIRPLIDALEDPDEGVRDAAAVALRLLGDESLDPLVGVLHHGSGAAQSAALAALDGRAVRVRERLIEWSVTGANRLTELHRQGQAIRAGAPTPFGSADFLADLLELREHEGERRILQAISVLGEREASQLIERALRVGSAGLRAQALEALETLADKRIAHALLPVLEAAHETTMTPRPAEARAALASLLDDPDPWVRALAMREALDRLDQESAELAARRREDPDALVRSLAGSDGWHDVSDARGADARAREASMTETRSTLSTMDRVLILRRVPIFRDLAPEDLQRLAETATEQVHRDGDTLLREHDLGDELLVVVDGTVRIVKEADGEASHEVGRAGPTDYLGELAILRQRPRAASVIAASDVRVLVIDGPMLRALLRERPQVAMAMLASLADQVSQQG